MGLKVIWTNFAKLELQKIFAYYNENATLKVAKKLVTEIVGESKKLSKNPEIGQRDELLSELQNDYRYLIFKSYKIVYYFNYRTNTVEIHDVFDSRQNPIKITRRK